jgi:hypothetical protein
MRIYPWFALTVIFGLTGCADLACFPRCQRHAQNSTSLVEFQRQGGVKPRQADQWRRRIPELVKSVVAAAAGGDPRAG